MAGTKNNEIRLGYSFQRRAESYSRKDLEVMAANLEYNIQKLENKFDENALEIERLLKQNTKYRYRIEEMQQKLEYCNVNLKK